MSYVLYCAMIVDAMLSCTATFYTKCAYIATRESVTITKCVCTGHSELLILRPTYVIVLL